MKIFNNLFEVYNRKTKIIIAQGTEEECDNLALDDYRYSVRLAKTKYYNEDDLLDVMNLGMALRQSQLNGLSYESGKEVLNNWIKEN